MNYAPSRIVQPLASTESDEDRFAVDVLMGLSGSPKSLPSKYFYDTEGSRLFQRITELPEYYLTRCELEILSAYRERLAEVIHRKPFHLIELGAGDGRKTKLVIDFFVHRNMRFRYIPIDICKEVIEALTDELGFCHPTLDMEGLICEYLDGLRWISGPSLDSKTTNLVLFLGSNIGNFSPREARGFMYNLWNVLNPGDYVLIGFDLKKDIRLLSEAYNDSQGVTAEFNRNLLRRVNRELGGDFDLDRFTFFSTYNANSGAVESFLISREKQDVHIGALRQSFRFEAWEPIQTEFSHKYLESEIAAMAKETGFVPVEHALDSRGYFMDSLWQVQKPEIVKEVGRVE